MDTYFRNEWQTRQLQILSPLLHQPIEFEKIQIFNHATIPFAKIPYDKIVQKMNEVEMKNGLNYKIDLTVIVVNKATRPNRKYRWIVDDGLIFVYEKMNKICVTITNDLQHRRFGCRKNMIDIYEFPKHSKYTATQNGYCDECENHTTAHYNNLRTTERFHRCINQHTHLLESRRTNICGYFYSENNLQLLNPQQPIKLNSHTTNGFISK